MVVNKAEVQNNMRKLKFILLVMLAVFLVSNVCQAAGKSKTSKVRKITSLSQAYTGHWKYAGVDGLKTDYYATKSTFQLDNIFKGTYRIISKSPKNRKLLIEETTELIGGGLLPITGQAEIIFSKDYLNAELIYISKEGKREKHNLHYIGKN